MKRTWIVALALYGAGCGNPVGPDNVPATDADFTIWYVCLTQPRQYIGPDGVVTWMRDHYIQRDPCPAKPID